MPVTTVTGEMEPPPVTLHVTLTLATGLPSASVALTTFWATVTLGRVLFASIERLLPEPRVYRVLPFVAAVAMAGLALLPQGSTSAGILAFALAHALFVATLRYRITVLPFVFLFSAVGAEGLRSRIGHSGYFGDES